MKELPSAPDSLVATAFSLPFPPPETPVVPTLGRKTNMLDYKILTDESMSHFAQEMNRGALYPLIASLPRGFPRSPVRLPDVDFKLHNMSREIEWNSIPQIDFMPEALGGMYPDGFAGFFLSYKEKGQKTGTLLAATSIISPDLLSKGLYNDDQTILTEDFPRSTAVIVHLQGVSAEAFKDEPEAESLIQNARRMLQKFRWEQLLTLLTIEWARTAGLENIGILSASRNAYDHEVPYHRLVRRYDTTAKRLGFTLDPEGIHLLRIR
jgi:hypothetical protein